MVWITYWILLACLVMVTETIRPALFKELTRKEPNHEIVEQPNIYLNNFKAVVQPRLKYFAINVWAL
jgi:hypothetical protein